MNRRNILIGLGVVAVGAAAGGAYWLRGTQAPTPGAAGAGSGATARAATEGGEPIFEDDRILGDADAPITILEYSSLTCPHCASFHRSVLPQVKADWIDAGRARLVYRHYPLDQLALRAAAAANCIEGDSFFGFLDVLFENQQKWARSDDPMQVLQQYAALAGLGPDDFAACSSDDAEMTRILEKQTDGRDRYSIASTPSFVINGSLVVGARGYEEFNTVLEQAAPGAS